MKRRFSEIRGKTIRNGLESADSWVMLVEIEKAEVILTAAIF